MTKHKRSKIRTENRSKEYQSAVSEPSLQVLYTHGLTHKRIENFLDGQVTFHLAEGNDAFAAQILLGLQNRSLLATILKAVTENKANVKVLDTHRVTLSQRKSTAKGKTGKAKRAGYKS